MYNNSPSNATPILKCTLFSQSKGSLVETLGGSYFAFTSGFLNK